MHAFEMPWQATQSATPVARELQQLQGQMSAVSAHTAVQHEALVSMRARQRGSAELLQTLVGSVHAARADLRRRASEMEASAAALSLAARERGRERTEGMRRLRRNGSLQAGHAQERGGRPTRGRGSMFERMSRSTPAATSPSPVVSARGPRWQGGPQGGQDEREREREREASCRTLLQAMPCPPPRGDADSKVCAMTGTV